MIAYGFKMVSIEKEYFNDNKSFIKMLDTSDIDKQARRLYLFLEVIVDENRILIPLRSNLGEAKRKFGIIGYSVPSKKKPLAGLDYRYILIVNDEKYLNYKETLNIPRDQQDIIRNNYDEICDQARDYITSYIKAALKNKEKLKPRFKESSLHNFHKELKIDKLKEVKKDVIEAKKEVALTKDVGIKDIIKGASKKDDEHNKKKDKN